MCQRAAWKKLTEVSGENTASISTLTMEISDFFETFKHFYQHVMRHVTKDSIFPPVTSLSEMSASEISSPPQPPPLSIYVLPLE
jgi:hypothetical protein